ncbi:Crp/Fnr family transcriptional regulator [uncultured Winogradskyella sp.]|uniref:Crp/Fnr family transcriptional regulator n=1 Tax=uncultured Winogradskyella sp. TaxID=395353 RepID=UPI00260F0A55|nr:Crp/Fnr family transcriptional regulator [uncultured Winogradskyella sp.]
MPNTNSTAIEIFKDLNFSKDEIKIISSVLKRAEYKKGKQLLQANEAGDIQYYVYEGCLRLYHIDANGKDRTIQFAIKDWWICDCTAFFTDTKATMNIEVISDAIVYELSKKDRDFLYEKSPKIESFFRKKLERAFASFQTRMLGNISLPAKERYINFINTYPNIEKSIKNYHIASYLGITTESLSRIRKELSNS